MPSNNNFVHDELYAVVVEGYDGDGFKRRSVFPCSSVTFTPNVEHILEWDGRTREYREVPMQIGGTMELEFTAINEDLKKLILGTCTKAAKYRMHLPTKVYVNKGNVTCCWRDGTKTTARPHGDDEFDLATGVMVCAIKKWMPGGSYWFDVASDIEDIVDWQDDRKSCQPIFAIDRRPGDVIRRGEVVIDGA